jgi:hypothetical protein
MGKITKGENKKTLVRRARAMDKGRNLLIYTRLD